MHTMQTDTDRLSHDLIGSWGASNWLSRSLGSIPLQRKFNGWASNSHGSQDAVDSPWTTKPFSMWGRNSAIDRQARFQQRQLEEKEQKLVKMYESAQAQALRRVGGNTPSPIQIANNPGKVRQMFEERRTKGGAGIDKSYPLQPLGGGARPPQGGRTHPPVKNGVHTITKSSTVSNDGHTITSHEVTMEIRQRSNHPNELPSLTKTQRFEAERIFKDHNLNEDSLDDVTFPDAIGMEHLTLDSVPAKLPNVGGAFPSQRLGKNNENHINNNSVTRTETKKMENGVRANGDAKPKMTTAERTKVAPVPRAARTQSNVSIHSTPKAKPTPVQQKSPSVGSPTTPKARTPVEKPKSPVKTSVSTPTVMASKSRVPPSTSAGDGVSCRHCQRRFASDRLQKHEDICGKAQSKKRKPYDAIKHRIAGTEVESYVKVVRKGNRVQATPKSGPVQLRPNNWRKKHEDFINAIRAAKQMQAHISKGGKLSDLPPPPPSENADYVSCPHCNRRFNQGAAERHIPKCANFQFNKPKPQAAKRR